MTTRGVEIGYLLYVFNSFERCLVIIVCHIIDTRDYVTGIGNICFHSSTPWHTGSVRHLEGPTMYGDMAMVAASTSTCSPSSGK